MFYQWMADLLLSVHLAFVVFVVLGGLLVLRRPKLAWVHGPAAVWGILIEYAGLICPLTPLEVEFRRQAGQAGYEGGFIEHYVTAVLYPSGLTRGVQIGLGTFALLVNVVIYWQVVMRYLRRARELSGNRDRTG